MGGIRGGPYGWPNWGAQKRGPKKRPKTVPTGRVIKYPKKCALFGPPGPPGGPRGATAHPGGTPPGPPISYSFVHILGQKGVQKGPFSGAPKKGPPGPPGGPPGAPGRGAGNFPPGKFPGPRGGPPGGPPRRGSRGVPMGWPFWHPLALLSSYGHSLIGWSAVATHHRVAA